MKETRLTGTIKYWNGRKGFGFIEPEDGGKQVFVHIKAFTVRKGKPVIGQVVTYTISSDDQGRTRANDVLFEGEVGQVKVEEKETEKSGSIFRSLPFIAVSVLVLGYIVWTVVNR